MSPNGFCTSLFCFFFPAKRMELLIIIQQITSFFLLFLCQSLVYSLTTGLYNCSSSSPRHVCVPKESSALLEFKNTFSIDKSASLWCSSESRGQVFYPKTETWNESMDCCCWDGVECNEEGAGHVIGLDLTCNGLSGTIHPNSSLFTLSHLQSLNLAHNHFHFSPLSPQFGVLQNLKILNLTHSFLFGDIPLEISHLSKLTSLDLSLNFNLQLSNPILNKLVNNLTSLRDLALDWVNLADTRPDSLMNLSLSLTSLSLSWCQLSGDFPNHILVLPDLRVLEVYGNNQLNGYFPKSNWSKSLEILDLHSTNFSKDIPNTISEAKSVKFLDLSSCNFNGSIPESIGNLTQLTALLLSGNELNGKIPSAIANLDQLISIDVFDNRLSGSIPDIWTNLHKLTKLDLGRNSFSGQWPDSIFNLTQLSYLRASYNFLSGPLPTHIPLPGFLNLLNLDLGNNSLNSTVPSWLFASPRLVHVDLSHNQFIGFTRDFKSNSLENLDFTGNKFQGRISESIYRQVNLTSLKLGSNNFSGVLNLDMLLRLKSLSELDVSNNNQLLIYFTSNADHSSVNLKYVSMASCVVTEFPYLRNHKNLTHLDLSNNQIQGEVPSWLPELDALYFLNISHNLLSGGIEVLPLTKLQFIFLHFNLFKMPISMPPPSIKQFTASNNQFHGNIHPSICQATALGVLDMSNNSLSGTIPSCLGNMTFLLVLDLKNNFFSGVIPMPPPLIAVFTASNNQFNGKISPSICQATYLTILNLSNNSLSGTIPPCLMNMTYLLVLDLKRNSLSGIVPTTFSKGSPLRNLELNGNQIDGELPESLLHCDNLEILNLGNNKISGSFPHWLEGLSSLRVLILRSNRFYGPIINNAMNIYSFPKLQIMDLSHNHFNGALPKELFQNLKAMKEIEVGKKIFNSSDGWDIFYQDSVTVTLKGLELQLERILTIFKAIDLSKNNFSGEIPMSIGMLISLKGLNISYNKIAGKIPTSFGNLRNLEWLDLSSNRLSGNIPQQLVGLSFLSNLNLSHNQLSGAIPQGNQFATFDNSSYMGNSRLCGFPLLECDDADKARPTRMHLHEDFSFEKGFWWKVVLMGYGCGVVFGYVVFRSGRPVWVMEMVEGKKKECQKELQVGRIFHEH